MDSTDQADDDGALEINESLMIHLEFSWSGRNGKHGFITMPWGHDPELQEFLLWVVDPETEQEDMPAKLTARLAKMGLLVEPRAQPARAVPFDFDLPLVATMTPPWDDPNFNRSAPMDSLMANPACFLQTAGQVPAEVATVAARATFIQPTDTVLWCRDPGTEIVVPFRMNGVREELARYLAAKPAVSNFGAELTAVVERLAASATNTDPTVSTESILEVLRRAHLVVERTYPTKRKALWDAQLEGARSQLGVQQYVVLRRLVNPVSLGMVRAHYRKAVRLGFFRRDHMQSPLRLTKHNEPVVRFFQEQFAALISRITPERLKGSYTMSAFYEPWAVLKRHTDRPQCAWNLSFPIDYEPERTTDESWPIFMDVDGVTHEVKLGIGDGLLYRGTDLPHWRNAQPDGHTSSVCFFHFVPEEFEGNLD